MCANSYHGADRCPHVGADRCQYRQPSRPAYRQPHHQSYARLKKEETKGSHTQKTVFFVGSRPPVCLVAAGRSVGRSIFAWGSCSCHGDGSRTVTRAEPRVFTIPGVACMCLSQPQRRPSHHLRPHRRPRNPRLRPGRQQVRLRPPPRQMSSDVRCEVCGSAL